MTEPILRSYGKVSSDDDSQNVTPETVFMIASISKVFGGVAVLKLVSDGVIGGLDDDICNVLPDDYNNTSCRNPSWPDMPITWRMLVTHRSSLREGIPTVNGKDYGYGPTGGYDGTAAGNPTCPLTDVTEFYRDFMIDKETTTSVGGGSINWYEVALDDGGAWEDFEPGTLSMYSNFGSGYIAALVEYATGETFPDFCRDHIFLPLGMKHTAWFREDLSSESGEVLEAMPVTFVGGNEPYKDVGHYCFIDYASGSLRTSVADMARFLDSMVKYGAPILWSRSLGEMAVRCAEGKSTNVEDCEFGVNWEIMQKDFAADWLDPIIDLDWADAVMHGGFETGSQTQVILLPKAGFYAVVFTNTDGNADTAAEDLMNVLLETVVSNNAGGSSTSFASNPQRTLISLLVGSIVLFLCLG